MLASVGRAERRHHGALYVQGLLLDGDRKSIEPLARRVPGADVQALQQFVGQSPWAWEPVRRRLAQRMAAALKPAAAWVIDDTGFPKQGRHSVGVARQYSGTLGKVGNCQVAVTVNLSTETESMPLNWALYLPQAWVADTEHCRRAGVPAQRRFRTKPELALELIDQLLAWGLRPQPVLADAGYGNSTSFRAGLARRGLQYVVGVESSTAVWETPIARVLPRRSPGRPRQPDGRGQPVALRDLALALPPQAMAHRHLAPRHARSTAQPLRRLPGAAGSRPCPRPARAGVGLAADRMATGHESPDQVLVLELARGRLAAPPGTTGQAALAGGTELPAAEGGSGAGPLRRTRLARLASPCHPGVPGLCLFAVGAPAP